MFCQIFYEKVDFDKKSLFKGQMLTELIIIRQTTVSTFLTVLKQQKPIKGQSRVEPIGVWFLTPGHGEITAYDAEASGEVG